MGGWTGIWQWVIVLAIILVLFGGRGKISALMGDFGKGLKSFKKGMKEEEAEAVPEEGQKALKSEQAEEVSEPETKKDKAQQS
ncbi:MAG: twin-arginine translocase TatA/TatE family subunit [Rhodospirillaceae bacterium]|jgi:sec-independent protein translocase protein TatA|nr:twin-arginine translocase TatA/TatE family subunit [Rhodospirillaceae bacterium]|tara:strand:+ start:2665 stop:2913 length:249 start_codon:yes stop_codon:yes gene_type:complete